MLNDPTVWIFQTKVARNKPCVNPVQNHKKHRKKYLKGQFTQKLNSVIIYSPSSSSKPIWMSLFCRTQRRIFWREFVARLFWTSSGDPEPEHVSSVAHGQNKRSANVLLTLPSKPNPAQITLWHYISPVGLLFVQFIMKLLNKCLN